MADGELYEPADFAGSDIPSRFDISGYRTGLFGGPGADLFGEPGIPVDREPMVRDISPNYTPFVPEPTPVPAVSAPVPAVPVHKSPQPEPLDDSGLLVRPYTRTGGRTRPDYDLAIEALISTSERGWDLAEPLLPEHRSICDLCADPRSVAEVAALLRLPLGVVRVLIGDMAGMGLVVIHSSAVVGDDRPSLDFLERVLSGLRRL